MARRLKLVAALLLLIGSMAGAQQAPAPGQTQAPPSATSSPLPAARAAAPVRELTLTPDYSAGRWFFPYASRTVAAPLLTNSPRIEQLIQGGKLMLSLEDAVSLALENNLDIAVQRFTPLLDETALLRARSGVNGRQVFDPVLTGQGYIAKVSTPINNPFLAGVNLSTTGLPQAPDLISHTSVGNFTYTQGFSPGTALQVSFNNTRSSANFAANIFNPYSESFLTVQLTQPLLNGFGKLPNTRFILEAKNTVKVGQSQFAQQVINSITQVSTDYWELVFARENVKVEQATVAVDQQLYENNKKQLEIGTMAPLDVITAQSQLASDQQALVQAQTVQLQDETTLLVAITKDPLAMTLAGIEIEPTTPISTPEVIENIPLQTAVQEAWQKRPELQQAALNLQNADIEVKATKNELLPAVNLFGLFEQTGIAGVSHTNTSTVAGFSPVLSEPVLFANGTQATLGNPAVPIFVGAENLSTVTTTHNTGYIDNLDSMIRNNYPTYEAGITLSLPIRNRSAQADNAQALLTQRQQQTQYRQTQNTIVLNVRQTLIALVQGRAAVAAAEQAEMLAQQTLDDEQKKYQLGASTSYNVVLRSRDLTAAQGTLLRDRINLVEAEVNFNQSMGRTLDVNNITIEDAARAKIAPAPNIIGASGTPPRKQ
jgi:outer membrane protein